MREIVGCIIKNLLFWWCEGIHLEERFRKVENVLEVEAVSEFVLKVTERGKLDIKV